MWGEWLDDTHILHQSEFHTGPHGVGSRRHDFFSDKVHNGSCGVGGRMIHTFSISQSSTIVLVGRDLEDTSIEENKAINIKQVVEDSIPRENGPETTDTQKCEICGEGMANREDYYIHQYIHEFSISNIHDSQPKQANEEQIDEHKECNKCKRHFEREDGTMCECVCAHSVVTIDVTD